MGHRRAKACVVKIAPLWPPTQSRSSTLSGLPGGRHAPRRRREWGFSVEAGGWPLHVGVAIRDGLLRAQAQVVEADRLDEHTLLFWNRELPLVRFAHTGAGEV